MLEIRVLCRALYILVRVLLISANGGFIVVDYPFWDFNKSIWYNCVEIARDEIE